MKMKKKTLLALGLMAATLLLLSFGSMTKEIKIEVDRLLMLRILRKNI